LEIKNIFKEHRDTIFGYSSFIGLVITTIYTIYLLFFSGVPEEEASLVPITIILAVVNLCFGTLSIYAIRRYDKLHQNYNESSSVINSLIESIKNLKSVQMNIAQITHNFAHEYRKQISELYTDLINQDYDKFENRKASFDKFLLYMIANIKEAFDVITGDVCSACIKMLDENKNVRTKWRDPISYRSRSNIDKRLPEYPFWKNTAFRNILDPGCPPYYISNNLSGENSYNNANPEWKALYNACLVIPIRLVTNEVTEEWSVVLGFICVDNKNGGFDDKIALDFLASFGDLCFHLFKLFSDLEIQKDITKKQKFGFL